MPKIEQPKLQLPATLEGISLDGLINEDPLALIQLNRNIEGELERRSAEQLKPMDLQRMWSCATIEEYLNFGKPHESVQTDESLQKHIDKRNMLHYFASQLGCSTIGDVFDRIESRQVPVEMMLLWGRQGLFSNSYWHAPVTDSYPECAEVIADSVAKFVADGEARFGGPIGLLIQAAKDFKKAGF